MDSRSRKRHRLEQPDLTPNPDHAGSVLEHQEAQPSELKAEHPQLLPRKPESTTLEYSQMKWELKREGVESSKPNAEHSQLCPKSDSTPPEDTNPGLLSKPESISPKKRRENSVLKGERAAELNGLSAELGSKLDPLSFKDSEPELLLRFLRPESIPPNDPGQGKKRKNKSELNAEDLELCPKLDPLPPKESAAALPNEPEPATLKELDQPKKRRRKRKNKSVVNGEGTESNRPYAEDHHLFPELDPLPPKDSDPLPPKDSDPALVLEPEPAHPKVSDLLTPKDSDPALVPESEPAPLKEPDWQKRRRRKRKNKSVVNGDEAGSNRPNAENPQLFPELDPLPPKESDPALLPEPEAAPPKNSDLIPPKDSDPALLPEPEPAPPKEPDGQRKRRRKRKNKSVVNGEGTESNRPSAENPQQFPELDPLSPKDSDPALLPEPGPPTLKEPEGQKKKGRKRKNKSVVNGEGTELNKPNAENPQLFPQLDLLPPKESDLALLPEPEATPPKEPNQPKKKNRKKKKKSAVNSEGAELNRPNEEHPQASPELEPLSPKDSDPGLLSKPEPAPPKEPDQPKKKKKKMIKKKEFFRKRFYKGRIHYMTRQLGNISKIIPPPKYLRKNKEICFFCLELGHSLGKCPVSPGAKFANCIVCNERGHLSTNCPQNSPGIDPKVFPADQPIKASAVGTEENGINEATSLMRLQR